MRVESCFGSELIFHQVCQREEERRLRCDLCKGTKSARLHREKSLETSEGAFHLKAIDHISLKESSHARLFPNASADTEHSTGLFTVRQLQLRLDPLRGCCTHGRRLFWMSFQRATLAQTNSLRAGNTCEGARNTAGEEAGGKVEGKWAVILLGSPVRSGQGNFVDASIFSRRFVSIVHALMATCHRPLRCRA